MTSRSTCRSGRSRALLAHGATRSSRRHGRGARPSGPSAPRRAGSRMTGRTIRIANGQGFWGDSVDAPVSLVEAGGIDYLTLDYLAAVTMSIMQRPKRKDPKLGYAT